jgi:hypothetical protein
VGFRLLFSGIVTVIEGVNVSLNIIGDYSRCIRALKLLVYLGAGACTVVLLGALYARNLLLLRLPSCLITAAVYRVSVEFPFWLSRNFLREEGWI